MEFRDRDSLVVPPAAAAKFDRALEAEAGGRHAGTHAAVLGAAQEVGGLRQASKRLLFGVGRPFNKHQSKQMQIKLGDRIGLLSVYIYQATK